MKLSNDEYVQTQLRILFLAQVVMVLPLTDFLDSIGAAEAVGPMFDPTLYMKAIDNLTAIKRLADALRRFQIVATDLRSKHVPQD